MHKKLVIILTIFQVLSATELRFSLYKDSNHVLTSAFLNNLKQTFERSIFVETGTYTGLTALQASNMFRVYSVEVSPVLYEQTRQQLAHISTISLYCDHSVNCLHTLLCPHLQQEALKTIFWLDAHYSGGTGNLITSCYQDQLNPILDELQVLQQYGMKDAVILIDDVRCFGTLQEDKCYNGIQEFPTIQELYKLLRDINPNYTVVVLGDILCAFDATAYNPKLSKVVQACTYSRLYQDDDSEAIIEQEAIIMNAADDEYSMIQSIYETTKDLPISEFHADLWYGLTLLQKNPEQAYTIFSRVLDKGYQHWRIYWYMAQAAARSHQHEKAQELIATTLRMYPGYKPALELQATLQQPFEMIVYTPKNPVVPAHDSKHIVVVIASYNNASYYKINLDSVLAQNYDNFEVIITDDKSPDGTGNLIQNYLDRLEVPCKVTLIKNHIRGGALQNTYRPISWAKDDAIIACVDGDDALAHKDVLSLVNKTYANPDVWMTHGRLQLWNGDAWDYQEPIPTHVIRSHSFRSYPRIVSHLRTFYAGLFRHIKLKDLLYEGAFLGAAPDVAWTIPMMEMSGFHHAYMKDVLYRYNDDTPLNEFRVSRDLQLGLERFIRSKQPYAPLAQLQLDAQREPVAIDLILYRDRAGDDIQQALAHALQYIQPVHRVFIVVKDEDVHPMIFGNLAQHYNDIAFCCLSDAQIKRNVMRYIYSQSNDHGYVVFVPTSCTLHEPIDMQVALQKLKYTQAYSFCCDRIHKKILDKYYLDVDGVTYAHEIAHALQQGITPADLCCVAYNKNSIADICKNASYDSIEQLKDRLMLLADQTDVILFNR